MSTKPDPIFAVYAKYAPIRDLRWYLAYASRHTAEYGASTLAIIADMQDLGVQLHHRLNGAKSTAPASTAAQKRLVWTLIDRFKASIAGWYGNAGVERLEPLDIMDPLSRDYRAPVVDADTEDEDSQTKLGLTRPAA